MLYEALDVSFVETGCGYRVLAGEKPHVLIARSFWLQCVFCSISSDGWIARRPIAATAFSKIELIS